VTKRDVRLAGFRRYLQTLPALLETTPSTFCTAFVDKLTETGFTVGTAHPCNLMAGAVDRFQPYMEMPSEYVLYVVESAFGYESFQPVPSKPTCALVCPV
jgi:hypothetical protein